MKRFALIIALLSAQWSLGEQVSPAQKYRIVAAALVSSELKLRVEQYHLQNPDYQATTVQTKPYAESSEFGVVYRVEIPFKEFLQGQSKASNYKVIINVMTDFDGSNPRASNQSTVISE